MHGAEFPVLGSTCSYRAPEISLTRGDHPNSRNKAPRMQRQMKISRVGSRGASKGGVLLFGNRGGGFPRRGGGVVHTGIGRVSRGGAPGGGGAKYFFRGRNVHQEIIYHLFQNYYITAPYFWTISIGLRKVKIASQNSSWNFVGRRNSYRRFE